MTDFDKKVIVNFPGKIVRKDLTSLMKKGANVPTYARQKYCGLNSLFSGFFDPLICHVFCRMSASR